MIDGFAGLCAYVDESSCVRTGSTQEYLVAAAILEAARRDTVRRELRPLLLPNQVKLHWTDESPRRRQRIVDAIASLGAMNVVVAHLSERHRKTERFRRKCLEALYYELTGAGVTEVTLESRSEKQDKDDRAHIVALQGQGRERGIRICHRRGGEEPLLWIADAVLGSWNADQLGESRYLEKLRDTIVIHKWTPDSMNPSD